ncbi:unnamed protein product [Meloidogyne enterolobii]|uniref:Uncharacterized protein n=1 Tax=Meloidogyne enterolobii TaxID=390850 RepID=A0ACB0Z130_MELEN
MSILSFLVFLLALFSLALLDNLVAIENIWYPAWPDDRIKAKFNQTLLFGASFGKLLTAIACLGMSAFVEFEHTQIALRQDYFRLVLDQLSSLFGIGSAFVDLYAIYNKTHKTLNLKVSIGLSLIVAIWSLKSVDNNSFPFYKEDINSYRIAFSASQSSFSSITSPQYTIVIVHGILIILMSILSLLCACTCILASSCLRESVTKKGGNDFDLDITRKTRILAFLYSLWTLSLLCLLGIGLAELSWTGDYIGGDLLWIAVLLFCTGLLNTNYRQRNSIIIKFVLNSLSLSVCAEKAILSCWLTFQSFTHQDYVNERVFDKRSRYGQSILFGIQTIILFFALITSIYGVFVFGNLLGKQKNNERKYGVLHFCCSLSALFYAFTIIGSEIFFEIDKWYWGEAVLEQSQYYRLGNGLLGFTVFVIQIICLKNSQFLLSAILLQIILSSLALFTLNSTITNTYFLQILFNARASIGFNNKQKIILIVALCFAGLSAIACSLQIIFGTICILRCSYLLHHGKPRRNSQLPSLISYCTTSPIDDNTFNRAIPGSSFISPPSPELHQFSIRPIEEQTLYWSADENPYIYKSTKRIFGEPIFNGLPYNIDNSRENEGINNVNLRPSQRRQEDKFSRGLARFHSNTNITDATRSTPTTRPSTSISPISER